MMPGRSTVSWWSICQLKIKMFASVPLFSSTTQHSCSFQLQTNIFLFVFSLFQFLIQSSIGLKLVPWPQTEFLSDRFQDLLIDKHFLGEPLDCDNQAHDVYGGDIYWIKSQETQGNVLISFTLNSLKTNLKVPFSNPKCPDDFLVKRQRNDNDIKF